MSAALIMRQIAARKRATEKDKAARVKAGKGFETKLKKLKKKTALSATAFCKKHNISRFMLSGYINGSRVPSWESISEIKESFSLEGV